MGMRTGDGEGGESSFARNSMLADINITPFVDVMLVLLIIFMVTAPFAVSGVDIQLPKSKSKTLSLGQDPVVVSVSSQGDFFLAKKPSNATSLSVKFKQQSLDKNCQPYLFEQIVMLPMLKSWKRWRLLKRLEPKKLA